MQDPRDAQVIASSNTYGSNKGLAGDGMPLKRVFAAVLVAVPFRLVLTSLVA